MLSKYLSEEWLDADRLSVIYQNAQPFPHISMPNFIRSDVIERVLAEFPDLKEADPKYTIEFKNQAEIKFASRGYGLLSPAALELVAFLNSDVFLDHMRRITGIERPLLSDPYLAGAGYHEIKSGGLLKIHSDFNYHSDKEICFDRRLNLLLYLNKEWNEDWGGDLQLFDKDMNGPVDRIYPHFNTCAVFSTRSDTYHGHPDALACPEDRSRKSLALYYYTTGRPEHEMAERHTTKFQRRQGEVYREGGWQRQLLNDLIPPIFKRGIKSALGRD